MEQKNHRKIGLFKIILAGVLALGIGAFLFPKKSKHQEAGKADLASHPTPIATDAVRTGDVGIYVEALGIVTPVHTVNIISRVQGQLTQVNYQEGQNVHLGDSLVEIDPRPFQAAVTQAEGQLAHDRGLLKEAQIDYVRYKRAYKHNAISKQQLDDQEQTVVQDEGTVKADEGALATAQVNLVYCHMTSPIDGRVGLRLVDPGNMVQANSTTPLVVVTQLKPITVIFSVSEDHLPAILEQIHQGQTMQVEVFDRTQQKKLATGKLLTLDNLIDTTTGTVKLRAEFANEDETLFPNQFVNAKLRVTTEANQTLVATPAIQRNSQGAFVYVIKQDQTAEVRTVQVGEADGNFTAVEGIKQGEVVATDGFDKLRAGAKVTTGSQLAGTLAPSGETP